jgi:virulence-associated protein VagC
MDVLPSRVFMNGNSQAVLQALSSFDADFVEALEQEQKNKLPVQEREAL